MNKSAESSPDFKYLERKKRPTSRLDIRMVHPLSSRMLSVYSLFIFIPLLAACQSELGPDPTTPDANTGKSVQQAGAAVPETIESSNMLDLDYNQPESIDQSKPTLLGISLHDPMDDVRQALGKADAQYTMEDGTQVLVVHQYPGFTIGYNEHKDVHFIDVYSSDIDPGLSGIAIGSSVEDVLQALGEPDRHTNSVIMYEFDGITLKLDIDHTQGKIVSIKMF